MAQPICPYCHQFARLVDSAIVYGRSYGKMWLCSPCRAWVGVHKNSLSHKPLGRLANAELREWKQQAHRAFDPLWTLGRMSRWSAYRRAARLMGRKEIHIGEFDVEDCRRLITVLGGEP